MILIDQELEEFNISLADIASHNPAIESMYDYLNNQRISHFVKRYPDKIKFVAINTADHNESQHFLRHLLQNETNLIAKFLLKQNQFTTIVDLGVHSRTICLIDATGSMTYTLDATKSTVLEMFKEVNEVLEENNAPSAFEFMIGFYRNYNSLDEIFVHSNWSTNPNDLGQYLHPIRVSGGLGNEAIEVGLQFANKTSEELMVTQVLVIGDMPPNTQLEIESHRKRYNFDTKTADPTKWPVTFWKTEANKLKDNNIKISTFYVNKNAKEVFTQLASTPKDCHELPVQTIDGATILKHLVCKSVLYDIGLNRNQKGDTKQAESLREAYNKKHCQQAYKI